MLRRNILYFSKSLSVGLKKVRVPLCRTICTTQVLRNDSTKGITNTKSKIEPEEVFTNLNMDNDPIRNRMFEYNWGTWIKNDELEKRKRFTKFSISGLNEVVRVLQTTVDKPNSEIMDIGKNVKAITGSLKKLDSDDKAIANIKQIVSIHEGKHHHVYKVILTNGKALALRLPYRTMPDFYTERCLQSEAATSYYLQERLGLCIPKLIAYSGSFDNFLEFPFILSEYKEGDLLMKNWDPIIKGKLGDKTVEKKLSVAIDPIFSFMKATTCASFPGYGSLYFKGDIQEGKKLMALKSDDLFVLGPTTLRCYYRTSDVLDQAEIDNYTGPWAVESPLKMIKDLSSLIVSSLKKKELTKDSVNDLNKVIKVYQSLENTSEKLLDIRSSSIPNFEKLIEPRLHIPDLDPMNVVVSGEGEYNFLDFEGATTIPFIVSSAPLFIEYSGPKVFDINEVENFDGLAPKSKARVEYMQKRTRNQEYWEKKLVKEMHDMSSSASPIVKMVKDPFICVVRNHVPDHEYFSLAGSLFMLKHAWKDLREGHIVDNTECPIELTDHDFNQFASDYDSYQRKINSEPFGITGGWVPQDVFERLLKQGVVIKDGENWKVRQKS
ncbi:hypothetical protein BRETT_003062 [Brettanomyces bruxellensis]|uniref:Altered inheritance of mitochondria protein 9, mitochondrial n=1 Tax=Dekkera bruxellensis TaxID=5007 RepID=A0A871RFM1_DEKBR|nr:uncharacterized protein BRETT_003062 [Brettanomyces bruxellensis]QOU22875.1 hypothetical protein BRETT_003062 [Brettanomyces bruxellensis]